MNADWAMVIVTGIYVVATIFICWANIKSAKASKEQLCEMQRQYTEVNRPIIEVEFHYIQKTWYVVRFVNHGNKTAQHVKIYLESAFINSLPEQSIRKELERIKERECIIGVGQHYDLFIGSNKLRGNPNMKPIMGVIEYKSQDTDFQNDIFVDLEHYMVFYSSTTDEEKLLTTLKTISTELSSIKRALDNRCSEKKDTSEI